MLGKYYFHILNNLWILKIQYSKLGDEGSAIVLVCGFCIKGLDACSHIYKLKEMKPNFMNSLLLE
jgi:hypothetical protein